MILRSLFLLTLVLGAGPSAAAAAGPAAVAAPQHPKLSPFDGLRWNEGEPEVRIGDAWYRLVSFNGVSAADLLAFCKQREPDRWRKRFAEDLPEMLARMGHPVEGRTCDLVVTDLASGEEVTLAGVEMTREKRNALRDQSGGARPVGKPDTVNRVEREHAATPSPRFRYLAMAPSLDTEGASGTLTRAQAEEDLDELEWLVQHRFAYRDLVGVDYRAAFDAARSGLGERVSTADFQLLLEKLLGVFGDAHSGVAAPLRNLAPAGYLPFVLEESADGIVALRPDRTGYFSANFPFVNQLAGQSVEDWIARASLLAPACSPQLRRRIALGSMRMIAWLRRDAGLAPSEFVEVYFTSEGSQRGFFNEMPVAEELPPYARRSYPESGLREDGVAYLRIGSMSGDDPTVDEVHARMQEFREARGLVIDVRDNGGGRRDLLRALLPYFMAPDEPPAVVNVAAFRLRAGDEPDAKEGYLQNRTLYPAASEVWSDAERAAIDAAARSFEPDWTLPEGEFSAWHYMVVTRDPEVHTFHFDAPVVVLLNAGCFSATDVFLGAFEGREGVTLVGSASGGGSGRSLPYQLFHSRTGVRLSSMASFRPSGARYDGVGIRPDVTVLPRARDLYTKSDVVLDKALELLK